MKYLAMVAAFLAVQLVLGWIFWAYGVDLTVRGNSLGALAYIGTWLGGGLSFLVFNLWGEK